MEIALEILREMMNDRGHKSWQSCGNNIFKIDNHIMIYCCQTEKFNIESVKSLVLNLQQLKVRHAIVIYQNIITSSAKKAIDNLHDFTIELFEKKEVQYNVTKHRLYCKHEKIQKSDIDKEIPSGQIQCLPILLRNDPVSRYFHFSRGDIVRITRKNGSIAYRIVK